MTNIDIDFYCRAYDDFLSPEECEEYIDKYEETLRVDNEKWKNLSVCIRNDRRKNRQCYRKYMMRMLVICRQKNRCD